MKEVIKLNFIKNNILFENWTTKWKKKYLTTDKKNCHQNSTFFAVFFLHIFSQKFLTIL